MRKMALYAALLALAVLTGVVSAQDGELLRNPGFEQPYLDGAEGQVAEGWSSWHIGPDSVRPDFLPAPADRALDGDAQMYTSYLATHDAGLYQSVAGLTPGVPLTFSANVWVWSTRDDLNPAESVDPGLVTISVGIDTTGNVDPEGLSVIWSEPIEAYDEFVQVSISAAPTGEVATVFVRTTVAEARLVTDVYIDNASLTVGESTAPQPEPTADTSDTIDSEPTPVALEPTEEAVAPTEEPTEEATPEPTEEPVAEPTEEPAEPSFVSSVSHTVQPGDSYDLIARIYGSTVTAIKEANGVAFEDNLIYPGQVLVVPIPVDISAPSQETDAQPTEEAPAPTEEPTAEPTAEPTEEPTAEPTEEATAEPTVEPMETQEVSLETVYVVQRGDTLMEIAKRYNTTVFELGRLNNILNYNMIAAGQVLRLPVEEESSPEATPAPTAEPEPIRHFVQFGDSIFRLAAHYGVTAQAIIEANGLENPNRIYYGQTLIIPR